MIYDNANKVLNNFLNHLLIDIKLDWKHQSEKVILILTVFNFLSCTANVIKLVLSEVPHIKIFLTR